MKKITAMFLSLMISLSCSIPILGATTEELEKKEMLEFIEKPNASYYSGATIRPL